MPLSIEEANQRLIAASGGMFDIEEINIDGVMTKVWKSAPPTLRHVFLNTKNYFGRDYFLYENERMSYEQHYQRVVALAWQLRSRFGIEKGDRVALSMRNYPEWPVVFWATVTLGAVIVPLNAWWKGNELEYGLADSGSKVLFADGERIELLKEHFTKLPELKHVIAARTTAPLPAGMLRYEELFATAAPANELPEADIHPDDNATIFYTSGTTGNPKGALGSHRNMCSNLISGAFVRMRTEIRYGRVPAPPPGPSGHLLSVPLFHATGCHGILCGNTFAGNMIVTMYKWNPEEAIRLIEREKLASFGGVPSMVWQVIESPEFAKHDLSSVQSIGYGGAPSAPELVKRIGESFPQVKPSNGYGLTETSALTTSNSAEDYLEKPTSAGCPAPVSEVRIAGDDGQEVPRGTIGEVWIKGPQVVKGYWRKPEATAQSFTDGWLHTGDLGYMDGDGFLYIADRAKDMLIRGGENVYCVEVESALYSHPDVMDAAVVGIPHRVLGEEVGALVQIRPGGNPTEEELKKHVASQLAGFKVPVRIDMQRDPLPRNANGKIMKPEVKKLMGLA
ncbi:MAG: acyl--CoA ligase [Pseudomonadales bacterium]|nr:acyl--CoA ligase [Pseudomonadales bacterium]